MSVSTVADGNPLDPDDELLVAYLDGELDRKAQSALEDRLLENASLRTRLQQLQTGWDLLEDLPDPAPSLKLVESTLELVVADIVKEQSTKDSLWLRYRMPLCILAVCVAVVIGSYGIAASLRSMQFQQQLEDLTVAEFLDAYNYGDDLTLMRQLSADPEWIKMVAAARELGDITIKPGALTSVPIDNRESAIKELPLEQMDQLNSRWEQFVRLNTSNQDRIRQTAESVRQQPDAELLRETMQAYATWRQTLNPELRDQIESKDPAIRRAAIAESIALTQGSISDRSRLRLDDDTIGWIYFSLGIVLQERIKRGDTLTIEYYNDQLRRHDEEGAKLRTIAAMVWSGAKRPNAGAGSRLNGEKSEGGVGGGLGGVISRVPGGGVGGGPRTGAGRRGSMFGFSRLELPRPLQPHELETIELPLPEKALDLLDLVASGAPIMERATLQVWCEETVRREFIALIFGDSTLLERYRDMEPDQRNRIDLLPPKEFLKEMTRTPRHLREP